MSHQLEDPVTGPDRSGAALAHDLVELVRAPAMAGHLADLAAAVETLPGADDAMRAELHRRIGDLVRPDVDVELAETSWTAWLSVLESDGRGEAVGALRDLVTRFTAATGTQTTELGNAFQAPAPPPTTSFYPPAGAGGPPVRVRKGIAGAPLAAVLIVIGLLAAGGITIGIVASSGNGPAKAAPTAPPTPIDQVAPSDDPLDDPSDDPSAEPSDDPSGDIGDGTSGSAITTTATSVDDILSDGSTLTSIATDQGDDDTSTVDYSTYDIASGQPLTPSSVQLAPDGAEDCGAIAVRTDAGASLILDLYVVITPPAGTVDEIEDTYVSAADTRTLDALWTAKLGSQKLDDPDGGCNYTSDLTDALGATDDGAAALVYYPPYNDVVDLHTGHLRAVPDAVGVLGPAIVTEHTSADGNGPAAALLTDPATGAVHGQLTDSSLVSALGDESDNLRTPTPPGHSPLIVLGGDPHAIVVYQLPTGEVSWTSDRYDGNDATYDDATNTFVLDGDHVYGLSAASGKKLWGPVGAEVCGVTDGKVVVIANGQEAVLDAGTGQQLSFDATIDSCPDVIRGGTIAVDDSADGTVTFDPL